MVENDALVQGRGHISQTTFVRQPSLINLFHSDFRGSVFHLSRGFFQVLRVEMTYQKAILINDGQKTEAVHFQFMLGMFD
ncbi:MAG: hypothetical protein JMDDDDMK_05014 [Acidobacteria bacterium]|nr:hypothetical protein [Acidobacteriota bacterium]